MKRLLKREVQEMSQFIVVGVASIEARDPLSAWQRAHQESAKLTWEVTSIAPAKHPNRAVTFTGALAQRISRAQARRQIMLVAALLAAFAFPSHLAFTTILQGL